MGACVFTSDMDDSHAHSKPKFQTNIYFITLAYGAYAVSKSFSEIFVFVNAAVLVKWCRITMANKRLFNILFVITMETSKKSFTLN